MPGAGPRQSPVLAANLFPVYRCAGMIEAFKDFLDDISRCFTDRDLSVWRSRLILPFSLITRDGPVVLKTDEAIAENFFLYLKAIDIMRLDLVDRRVVSLEDCHDGTWLGTFETRLISQQILATAPYTSTVLLSVQNARFRMSSMLNGRGHMEWTGVRDK